MWCPAGGLAAKEKKKKQRKTNKTTEKNNNEKPIRYKQRERERADPREHKQKER